MSAPEAAAVAAAGAALGGLTAAVVGAPAWAGAVAGGASGAIAGLHGIYQWHDPRGVAAFVLDSTWALPTTAIGLAAHAAAAVRGDPQYADGLSRRRNRHVYGRGMQFRKGFALTVGNVVSGAGDVSRPRRAKLVNDHEDVHVWQARALGPAYLAVYGGSMVGGAVAAMVGWALGRGRFTELVESCAYYLNPLEYWAYSRDDHWPPSGLVAGLGPRRPLMRPFADGRSGS